MTVPRVQSLLSQTLSLALGISPLSGICCCTLIRITFSEFKIRTTYLIRDSPPLLSRLFLRTILGSQQYWAESSESFHIPPSTYIVQLPPINIPYQKGTFIIISEPTLIQYYYPKFIIYLRVHSSYFIYCRFWQMCHGLSVWRFSLNSWILKFIGLWFTETAEYCYLGKFKCRHWM